MTDAGRDLGDAVVDAPGLPARAPSGQSIRVSFPRASSQPWIVACSPGSACPGAARSIGFSGPVCEPGETPASEDAYISRRPAPGRLRRGGPDPDEHRDAHRDERGSPARRRPGRACPTCPAAGPRSHRRPRPGRAVRSGRTQSGRSIAPSTLSTTTSVLVGPARGGRRGIGRPGQRRREGERRSARSRGPATHERSLSYRGGQGYPGRNPMGAPTGPRRADPRPLARPIGVQAVRRPAADPRGADRLGPHGDA